MFKTRLLSGIVLVILAVAVLYFGGYVTAAATLLLAIGGVLELLRVYKLHNKLIGWAAYIATAVYFALLVFDYSQYVMPVIIVFVLAVLAIYVITYPTYTDKDAMAVILAFF